MYRAKNHLLLLGKRGENLIRYSLLDFFNEVYELVRKDFHILQKKKSFERQMNLKRCVYLFIYIHTPMSFTRHSNYVGDQERICREQCLLVPLVERSIIPYLDNYLRQLKPSLCPKQRMRPENALYVLQTRKHL